MREQVLRFEVTIRAYNESKILLESYGLPLFHPLQSPLDVILMYTDKWLWLLPSLVNL